MWTSSTMAVDLEFKRILLWLMFWRGIFLFELLGWGRSQDLDSKLPLVFLKSYKFVAKTYYWCKRKSFVRHRSGRKATSRWKHLCHHHVISVLATERNLQGAPAYFMFVANTFSDFLLHSVPLRCTSIFAASPRKSDQCSVLFRTDLRSYRGGHDFPFMRYHGTSSTSFGGIGKFY